jgi:hypothetical protein
VCFITFSCHLIIRWNKVLSCECFCLLSVERDLKQNQTICSWLAYFFNFAPKLDYVVSTSRREVFQSFNL